MGPIRVGVVGAGVIGLSSAFNIIENVRNVEVTILSETFSPHTTGDYSAGLWEPFVSSGSKIRNWSLVTFEYLVQLARSDLAGKLGAQFMSGYQLGEPDPFWSDIVYGFRQMTDREHDLFPTSGVRTGSFFTTVTIECSNYLPWLMLRFKEKGGRVIQRKVESLEKLSEEFDIVVNCCGMSASWLCNDRLIQPVRGQVIKVHAPWIKHFVLLDTGYEPGQCCYLLPGAKAVTVGGTTQLGDWNEEVDGKDGQQIWRRATQLVPSIKEGKKLLDWAGLRPYRPEVRLEVEQMKGTNGKTFPVIHNYGHGGSGVTLHWGCALEVTDLTLDIVQRLTGAGPSSKL